MINALFQIILFYILSYMKRLLLPVFILFIQFTPTSAADTITIQSPMYQVDTDKDLIIISEPADKINELFQNALDGIFLDRYYQFNEPITEVATGIPYSAISPTGSDYTIYFSLIPLVVINTPHHIPDEPRVYTDFTLIEPNGRITRSHAGAEIRGGLSQSFPKRSLRLEFWDDTAGNTTRDLSLLGMRNDDDWNLQAMYNEPLRLRSLTSNQLWKLIHSPYYRTREPDAVNGIEMKYVEFFLNGSYQGIYALGERVDRKQLQLEQYDGTLRGELYKGVDWGVTTFHSLPGFPGPEPFWDGFEYDYPEELVEWINLYGFADFIINEEDYYFYLDYKKIIELNNAVDYFIFLNLLRAKDNTGKNIFIARYDFDQPYFYVPWDLDGVFGTMYLGLKEPITNDLLSNGMYDRLIKDCEAAGFNQTLRSRWNVLRQNVITESSIMAMFQQNYDLLHSNGAYEREALTWPDYTFFPDDMDYLKNWLRDRLAYLDEAFNRPCQGVPDAQPTDDRVIMYPNPANENFIIKINGGLIPFEFTLYNSTGQTVSTKTLHERLTVMNLSHLPAGMYFIVLHNTYYKETKKLIISH